MAEDSESEEVCPICLDVFGNANTNTAREVLGCGHSFHAHCILTAFQSAATTACPLCRGSISDGPVAVEWEAIKDRADAVMRHSVLHELFLPSNATLRSALKRACNNYNRTVQRFRTQDGAYQAAVNELCNRARVRLHDARKLIEQDMQIELGVLRRSSHWIGMMTSTRRAAALRRSINRMTKKLVPESPSALLKFNEKRPIVSFSFGDGNVARVEAYRGTPREQAHSRRRKKRVQLDAEGITLTLLNNETCSSPPTLELHTRL